MLERLITFIGNRENIEVTITLNEIDKQYFNDLTKSLEQVEDCNELITFTMEEFLIYTPQNEEKDYTINPSLQSKYDN